MQKYLFTIAYHGAAYAGWQRQAGFDTVQERLEAVLAAVHGEAVVVHGAGRTDAGVHALAQCAHAALPRRWHDPAELLRAINGNLPQDIVVREVRPVPAGFHARFSARGKRYAYRFHVSRLRPVHGRDLVWWVRRPGLDLAAMRAAARELVGEHDFAAFASNPGYPRRRGTVRHVRRLRLVRRPRGLDLVVEGDGFLYNQVRAFAGTLCEVGIGKRSPAEVGGILRSRDRRRAGATAPAQGLYLLRVLYAAIDLEHG